MVSTQKTNELNLVSYLRGLASLGVVLYHVRHDMWVGMSETLADGDPFEKLAGILSIPCAYLGSGVLLFFVISGFCIHFPHAGENGRILHLRTYAGRRLLRIYPPYFAAIIGAFLIEYCGYSAGHLDSIMWGNSIGAIFLVQDFAGGQPVTNGPLWTIPVEVGFYLLFPFIFAVLRSQSRWLLRWTIAFSIVSIIFDGFGIRNTITKVFGYWFIWVLGAQLAERYCRGNLVAPTRKIGFLAFFSFALGLFFTTADILKLPGVDWIQFTMAANCAYGIAYLIGLQWCLSRKENLPSIPSPIVKSLSFLGDISYSLYLVHTPFFIAMCWLWQTWFGGKPSNFLVSLSFCLLAIVVAYIFYRLIEVPSHRLARSLSRSPSQL